MSVCNSPTVKGILDTLTRLLEHFSNDLVRRGQLECLQANLQSYLELLPDKLLEDNDGVLRLLQDVKVDHARLWEEVLKLRDEVDQFKASLRDIHERLAVRQVMAACNEKWIREIARRSNKNFKYLWDKRLYAFHLVAQDRALSAAWKQLLDELQLEEKDHRILRQAFKFVKENLDAFVHVNSFPKFTYDQIKTDVANHVFTGRTLQYKEDFLMFLEVNKRLSEMRNESLYDYEV